MTFGAGAAVLCRCLFTCSITPGAPQGVHLPPPAQLSPLPHNR